VESKLEKAVSPREREREREKEIEIFGLGDVRRSGFGFVSYTISFRIRFRFGRIRSKN
jgi:hypothetical protein